MSPSIDIHTSQPAPASTHAPVKVVAPTLSAEEALRAKFMHLEHHINSLSRQRAPSPLKDILQFMRLDGMISLAGGEIEAPMCLEYVADSFIQVSLIRVCSPSTRSTSQCMTPRRVWLRTLPTLRR